MAATEMHREETCRYSSGRRGWDKLRSSTDTDTSQNVTQTASGNLLDDTGSSNPGLCDNLEGWDGVWAGERFQREGKYVYPWLIPVDVWRKPT